ncbi:hypothetical protein [Nocardioides sp. BYT-33-1]|uniref:hypothetical protein n=1 Tax=Nocardioides sp. BYT-33-1 TaxID=3416952 RepID=UPI003F52C72F
MIALHLGALHPVEQIATFVLAFGPFVVLGIVILLRRRAEARDDRSRDGDRDHDPGAG